MKHFTLPIIFILAFQIFFAASIAFCQDDSKRVFDFAELESKRESEKRSYLSFLNVDSLHCGIYSLKAGSKDGQQPHQQDEIYYVESGKARIQIEGKDYDLKPGSIVFVPAHAKHHFHSITEDLKTLVFFSKGPTKKLTDVVPQVTDETLAKLADSFAEFNATFDDVCDANLFNTHGWICTAESAGRKSFKDHNHLKQVTIAKGAGVSGDCLRFSEKTRGVLFYKAKEAANFAPEPDWQGSISFWLKLDPDKDLGDGFCDPIQITSRKWNDGAIWVDFDKTKPRTFRLGVFSDMAHWNPEGIKWEDLPEHKRPSLVTVENPPFSSDQWTHVAITFRNINSTANEPAVAKLYLNGELQGTIERKININWDSEIDRQPAIMLGLNYVGDMDELVIFRRELSAAQIRSLFRVTPNQNQER